MAERSAAQSTLPASGNSDVVVGAKVKMLIYGTWVGTVVPQVRSSDGTWVTIQDESYTGATVKVFELVEGTAFRINFTRTSGTLEYDLLGLEPVAR